MKRTLIRYKTKPELADRNAELIAAVFAELKAAKPEGIRYLSLRLEDDTFVHFVETTANDGSSPLPKLAAFQAFQSGIRERCIEPPVARGVTIVGNYRMLSESMRFACRRQNDSDARAGRRRHRPPAGRDAAKTASLLRAHGRLGDRRRGRAAGCADQGGGGVRLRRRRSAIPRAGCSGSRTTPRWISCAAATGSRRCDRARRWT